MSRPRLIAIDGAVAVGKSTVGKLLSERLEYRFIDTGVMYRALTWLALKRKTNLEDDKALSELAKKIHIDLSFTPEERVMVDGQDVTAELRNSEVEAYVSQVSKVPGVRQALVAQQRHLAAGGKVVMAGRDIGTVVLPQAELKIFLLASPSERARRRHEELREKGEQAQYHTVLTELQRRDNIDSQRAISPLRPAPDAHIIDTEGLNPEQVIARILEIIEGRG